jgi:hypothetical protein
VVPFQLIDGAERRVHFRGGRFGLRRLSFERELAEAPRVRAEVKLEGGLLTGTVRNESDLPLDHALVMVGPSVARLGSIAPGQSVPVKMDPDAGVPLEPYMPLSYALFSTPRQRRTTSQSSYVHYTQTREMPNDPEIQRRARFVDRMFDRESGRGTGISLPMTFFAFTRAATARDVLGSTPGENVHELTMLRLPVELVLPAGRFVLPSGLNRPELIESSGGHNVMNVGNPGSQRLYPIELRGGSLTYAFRPPLPHTARPETITLKTRQMDRNAVRTRTPNTTITPGAAQAGVFSIYDWQRAVWQPLPEGSEHRLDARAYAGPGG